MRIILDSCHPNVLVFDDVLVDGLEFINILLKNSNLIDMYDF